MRRRKVGYVRGVISSLFEGMNVSLVPNEIRPDVIEELYEMKTRFIEEGDIQMVKRSQDLIRKLNQKAPQEDTPVNEMPFKWDKERKKKMKPKPKPKIRNKTPESLNALTIKLNGRNADLSNPEQIKEITTLLQASKMDYVKRNDLHSAQIVEDFIHEFTRDAFEKLAFNEKHEKYSNLQSRLEEAQIDYDDCVSFWDNEINVYQKERQKVEKQLAILHKQQMIDFEETWPKNLPPQYRKVSKTVLLLREQAKNLILTRRYEEAIPIQERANEIEEREIEIQKKNYELDFNRELLLLQRAQEKEIQCMKDNWDSKYSYIMKERKKELDVLKLAIVNIEKQLKPETPLHQRPFSNHPGGVERGRRLKGTRIAYQPR